MSVFITGDTHKNFNRFLSFERGKKLTKNDYVIILGDFGGIWDINKSSDNELSLLEWLHNKPWTTLFIDGNHENFDRINKFPIKKMFGGNVGIAYKSIIHLKRGEIYNINGNSFFVFGGGNSIDKDFRLNLISWWSQEMPNQKECEFAINNLSAYEFKIDYILSHSAPYSIVKLLEERQLISGKADGNFLQKFLDMIRSNCNYKKWFCGHFHIDEKIDEKHFIFYNKIIKLEEIL